MWKMPAETDEHELCWMAFPTEGPTLGETDSEKEECYKAWSEVALAVAEFEPVNMVVDPSEIKRAKNMLGSDVTLVEAPVDEFWMRDHGPTFVRNGNELGAVCWTFNGWGAHEWAEWTKSAKHGRLIAEYAGAEIITSKMVNEGGAIHVDGKGTVFVTDTVQLDERRNPDWTREEVEKELAQTLGVTNYVWMPRGLNRDYEEFGTNGHIDIVLTIANSETILLHSQEDENHPDNQIMPQLKEAISKSVNSTGNSWNIIEIPAPKQLRDKAGFVGWSYINHLPVNGGVIACGFNENYADARAREILSEAYGVKEIVTIDARPLFDRGGGIHCITQQQPKMN